jgi:hypothetical protein
MFTADFDITGIVHFEFILQGRTVNQAYYVEVVNQLHEAVHRKKPQLWPMIGFSMTMLQLTRRCQAVAGPKIEY